MRCVLAVLLLICCAAQAMAQDERTYAAGTLYRRTELAVGGFGAPVLRLTELNGEPVVMVGARAALVLDHRYAVGVALHASASEAHFDDPLTSRERDFRLTYYGVEAGLVFGYPNRLRHGPSVLFGRGFVHLGTGGTPGSESGDGDCIRVAEGAYHLLISVRRWLQVNGELLWRAAWETGCRVLDNDALSGPAVGIGVRLGRF